MLLTGCQLFVEFSLFSFFSSCFLFPLFGGVSVRCRCFTLAMFSFGGTSFRGIWHLFLLRFFCGRAFSPGAQLTIRKNKNTDYSERTAPFDSRRVPIQFNEIAPHCEVRENDTIIINVNFSKDLRLLIKYYSGHHFSLIFSEPFEYFRWKTLNPFRQIYFSIHRAYIITVALLQFNWNIKLFGRYRVAEFRSISLRLLLVGNVILFQTR